MNDRKEFKLFLKGSPEGVEKLKELFDSGKLTALNGFSLEKFEVIDKNSDPSQTSEFSDKWDKVRKIRNQTIKNLDLSGVDLSGTNLSETDLSGADLSDADLSDADLSGTNLSGADLSDADLTDADLSGANVKNARFGNNTGIAESLKHDLIIRGAIFED